MTTPQTPAHHICPITLVEMTDPVIDREGNTYERSAIMHWLQSNRTSPITRNPMSLADLVPNRALRQEIEASPAQPAQAQEPAPVHISAPAQDPLILALVLDTSGSMEQLCSIPSPSGETDNLTRLDLLKYTVRTILHSLKPGDQILINTFSYANSTLVPLTKITTPLNSSSDIIRKIDQLTADGQTNIYDAVQDTIRQVISHASPESPATIIMLTDGEPTVNPPMCQLRGIESGTLSALDQILPKPHPRPQTPYITLHTFGYGYDLNQSLLYKLATQLPRPYLGKGIFGFIPDASMLGTTLINVVALARYPNTITSILPNLTPDDLTFIDNHLLPALYNNTGPSPNPGLIKALFTLIMDLPQPSPSPFIQALMEDIQESPDPAKGQVEKATSNPVYYAKWGRKYIQSLVSAFESRTCINFKDNAIQLFKSPNVQAEQDRLSQIFLTIDPPRPASHYRPNYTSYSGSRSHTSQPIQMSAYLNQAGGCFHPATFLLTPDPANPAVRMDNIKKGTVIQTPSGPAKVFCVVKLKYDGPIFQVTPCLGLTGYHPFKTNTGEDYFPVEYEGTLEIFHYTGYVYDIILSNRDLVLTPDNFEVATLGHTNTDPKFDHAYFGISQLAIKDLQSQAPYGYNHTGLIIIDNPTYIRDPVTQNISGIHI
jgi:hypothetical protein